MVDKLRAGNGATNPYGDVGMGGGSSGMTLAEVIELDSVLDVRAPEKVDYGKHLPAPKLQIRTINDLADLDSHQLQELFAHGKAPNLTEFTALFTRPEGLSGLALAAPHHDTTGFGEFIHTVMLVKPWKGKRAYTAPDGATEGTGKNFILGMELAPFRWALVDSQLDPAVFGGGKVIRLDYSSPEGWGPHGKSLFNTLFGIREIHDEMKEVAPGVYLGMAAFKPADPPNPALDALYNGALALYEREERLGDAKYPIEGIFFVLGIKSADELKNLKIPQARE
jgi:hypothetical protein